MKSKLRKRRPPNEEASRWNRDTVVREAARLVDEIGFDALTTTVLAKTLEIKPPSLYKHIESLDDLRASLKAHAGEKLMGVLTEAAVGRSSDDAVKAVAQAYRDFALRHPGLQTALNFSSETEGDSSDRIVVFGVRLLSAYALPKATTIHALRTLRSLVHGFAVLESSGGFKIGIPTDESFRWAVEGLIRSLKKS